MVDVNTASQCQTVNQFAAVMFLLKALLVINSAILPFPQIHLNNHQKIPWYQTRNNCLLSFMLQAVPPSSLPTFCLKVGQAPIIHCPICSFPALKVKFKIDTRSKAQHGKTLRWNHNGQSSNQLDLGFSLIVDWFIPRGNKLACKHKLARIIFMNCMNLPPTIMTTITHLLKPLVDKLPSLMPFTVSKHKSNRWLVLDYQDGLLLGSFGQCGANCCWVHSKPTWEVTLCETKGIKMVCPFCIHDFSHHLKDIHGSNRKNQGQFKFSVDKLFVARLSSKHIKFDRTATRRAILSVLALWLWESCEWSVKWCIVKLCSLETKNWLGELEGSMIKQFCQILEAQEDLRILLASKIPEDGLKKQHVTPIILANKFYGKLLTHACTINWVILQPKLLIHATWDCKPKVRVSVLQPKKCVPVT
ncbi:uncharacterized protein VP01_118g6 [Puccinia sorghi]|uniref:Uncharacterized protein n=1 Tax=Puccinia sorghi TaxID=27349 RepID=A0A0L6VR34_9BASI|nr:uncharacterized protein VP01_118g6 [Puccinia sorghi]